MGAEKEAKLSGDSFARLFGVISPKIRTITVMTAVGNRGAAGADEIYKPNGSDGGKPDINYVVPHKNGGKQLVVIIEQLQNQRGFFVALLCGNFYFCKAQAAEGGFRCGEKCRHCNQNQHYYNCCRVVHKTKKFTLFIKISVKKHSPKAKPRPGYALLNSIYIHRMSASSIFRTFR